MKNELKLCKDVVMLIVSSMLAVGGLLLTMIILFIGVVLEDGKSS